MNHEQAGPLNTRIDDAILELQASILERYPEATFEVRRSPDEPDAIHLIATVDVEDTDDVFDLVADRVLDLQIDEEVPVFVIPVRPQARVRELLETANRSQSAVITR